MISGLDHVGITIPVGGEDEARGFYSVLDIAPACYYPVSASSHARVFANIEFSVRFALSLPFVRATVGSTSRPSALTEFLVAANSAEPLPE